MKKIISYALMALCLLYTNKNISQVIENDSLKILDVHLEEVVVAAFRASDDTPVTYSEITREELRPFNIGQDIPTLLKYTPGVITHSDSGNGIGYSAMHIRGSDETRINVTINGIPLNDAESLNSYWVDIPDLSSSINNIQIQRGVGTSTNGAGAFGGSINILTDVHSNEPISEYSTSFGSYGTLKNTFNFSTGLLNDKIEFSGRLSKIESDGYVDRASSNLRSYFLQAIYETDETVLKFLNMAGHEITYQSWFGIDGATLENDRTYNPAGLYTDDEGNIHFYNNQEDNYKQDHYQFHWNQRLNNNWVSNLSLHYTYGRGYYEEYVEDQHMEDYGLAHHHEDEDEDEGDDEDEEELTDLIRRKWLDNDFYGTVFNFINTTKKYELILGGSWNNYYGKHFGEVIWARHAGESEIRHKYYDLYGDKTELNLYSKLDYHLNEKISLFADFQLRSINYDASLPGEFATHDGHVHGNIGDIPLEEIDKKYRFFNPKLGIYYKIDSRNEFYFSFARANREPTRTDFSNGNPNHEELDDFELGYKSKTNNSQTKANLYFMNYTNQLVLTGQIDDVGNRIKTNSGKSYRLGVEIEDTRSLGNKLALYTNITASINKNKDFYYVYDGELQNFGDTDLSFSPNLIGVISFNYELVDNLDLSLNTKYISDQYMSNINSSMSKLDSFTIVDFNVFYQFSIPDLIDNISVSLLVNNLFNKLYVNHGYHYTYDDTWTNPDQSVTYEGVGYYPQATRNYLLGITFKF